MPRKRPPASSTSEYLTLTKAEHEYGVNYFQMYRWVERGLLKRVDPDLSGRSIIIRRSELTALLERNLVVQS